MRVFQGARGTVTYLGGFAVYDEYPWCEADASESGGGSLRRVIVFRLKPIRTDPQPPQTKLARLLDDAKKTGTEARDHLQDLTERSFVNPAQEPYEVERQEASLVQTLAYYSRGKGHAVGRHQMLPRERRGRCSMTCTTRT
ncbi:hypothetical protein [Microbispora sp. H10670]|uniref:hypothetical protein n=1 Tax=Microbispora sp. H10670 TaxID=2729108 RepID=UPI0016034D92|nr:hypothetical protein [Microbispora sp. H10670]